MMTACSSRPISEQAIAPIFKLDSVQSLEKYKLFIGHPTPSLYSICRHKTCREIAFASLSDVQWQNVEALFAPPAISAEHERGQIQQAVALLETYTGEQTNTHNDRGENDSKSGIQGQMDCIDEATNTTVYLRMISKAGLLTWHKEASRIGRGVMTGNIPHNTATIIEIESGTPYAVDSWFEDNGVEPHILPLAEWKSGWWPQ